METIKKITALRKDKLEAKKEAEELLQVGDLTQKEYDAQIVLIDKDFERRKQEILNAADEDITLKIKLTIDDEVEGSQNDILQNDSNFAETSEFFFSTSTKLKRCAVCGKSNNLQVYGHTHI